jgi:PAS domain S-box-containing protein
MRTPKNTEYAIENIADIVDNILDQAPIEEVLKVLVDKIPSFFSEPENVAVRVEWMDKRCESFACGKNDFILTSDIVIKGKKEGFIEITIKNKNKAIIEDIELINGYEKLLQLISRMISVFFEKRREVVDLKELEKKTRNYCEKLEDHIFIVDSKGNIIDFNKKFVNCLGHTIEELLQMNISSILSQCTTDIDKSSLLRNAIETGCSKFEVEHNCDGEIIQLSITCKPLEDSEDTAFICVAKDISETKQTESELHESEKKYSTIVEKGNDGIIIVQEGKIKFTNSKILNITGYTHNDLINKDYLELISQYDHHKCLDWFSKRNGNSDENSIFSIDMVTKENKDIPAEINASVIDYAGENAELLIVRDISERKRSQDLLQKERDRLENYLDVVGSIIGIVNSDSEIIFVNQIGADVLGYPKDDIIGKNWFDDFLPESVREMTRQNFYKVMDGELTPPQYFENLLLTKTGDERLIFWHDVPLEDETGKRIGMISSGEDITENRKIEAMLIESEKNLKAIFDHVDDQIYIYKPYGKFIDVNMAVIHSTGYTKEEMLEMTPHDMLKPEVKPLMDGYTRRILKEKNIMFELYHVHKDGTLLPLEINSKLIEYKGEQAIISVARDITERKKSEERLKRYAGELRQSNELKDLFTDIIRHDLLTPASVIKGYTEELLLAIKDEQTHKLAEKVRDNNDRLIELLETATKLAKLQREDEITFEKIDIVPIFKMVIDSFRTQLELKEHDIIISGHETCHSIINPVIEEVFVNLISNAIKYSPEKSNIEIAFTDEGSMWKISVTDYGIGISDNEKPLLFTRFHRADKKGIKGTGLGLAIVKRIVELHDGKFGVEDNPKGKGSVFWVTVKKG